VLGVVSLDQISHDSTGLEKVDLLSIGEGIGKCWNAAIGIDSEE